MTAIWWDQSLPLWVGCRRCSPGCDHCYALTQAKRLKVGVGDTLTLQTTGVTMVAVTGLTGFALSENKALATLPLTCYVLGSAMTTIPASYLMKRVGRRIGFQLGTAVGMLGSIACSFAVYMAQFWMLCAGMMVMGVYTAFGKYYRFAAADAASVEFRAKAISLTLAGGIVGGVTGPEMAKRTHDLFVDHPYMGSYMSLGFVCLLAMLILTRLDIPKLSEKEIHDPGRPLAKIMRQPEFVVAVLASMLSYGIMNLMMTSTPLAMRAHDHHFNDAAMVLEWHVFGMYGPSFFTGSFIKRFGTVPVMLVGAALIAISVANAGYAFHHSTPAPGTILLSTGQSRARAWGLTAAAAGGGV